MASRWLILLFTLVVIGNAHTIITYPGDRGDTLHSNGSVEETRGLGKGQTNTQQPLFPYGMQWEYPCSGLPVSSNRTKWPISGGAIALQPGWFLGHKSALFYINLGLGTIPYIMDIPLVPVFQMIGPSNDPFPGTFCLPHVGVPKNVGARIGDNATIQIILTAQHGASLYNCADIIFAEEDDPPEVTDQICFNSTDIGFGFVGTVPVAPGH